MKAGTKMDVLAMGILLVLAVGARLVSKSTSGTVR